MNCKINFTGVIAPEFFTRKAPEVAMTTVFRVETECGNGPYNSNCGGDMDHCDCNNAKAYRLRNTLAERHTGDDQRPAPWNDGIDGYTFPLSMVFGFESLEAATSWFKGWGADLADAGFRLSEYLVPEESVRRGGRQVMFDRLRSRLTGALSTEVFEVAA